jgi:hypothetical protein
MSEGESKPTAVTPLMEIFASDVTQPTSGFFSVTTNMSAQSSSSGQWVSNEVVKMEYCDSQSSGMNLTRIPFLVPHMFSVLRIIWSFAGWFSCRIANVHVEL